VLRHPDRAAVFWRLLGPCCWSRWGERAWKDISPQLPSPCRRQVSQPCGLGGVREGEAMEILETAAPSFSVLQCHDLEMMNRNTRG